MKFPAVLFFRLFVFLMGHPLRAQSLAEAIDQPSLTVYTSAAWQASADPSLTHDGTDSAVCTLTSSTDPARLITTIIGPVRVGWWWRMTGTGQGRISAFGRSTIGHGLTSSSTEWVRAEITVPAGTHQVDWTAERTQGTVSFAVDEVSVLPWGGRGLVQWQDSPSAAAAQAPYEPAAVSVTTTAGGGWPFGMYQWHYAVRRDGTVVSWGHSGSPALAAPAGLANVQSIAAGQQGAIALHRDGTVTGWGAAAPVPVGINNAVQIAAGYEHYLVLGSDGRVRVWGFITRQGPLSAPVISPATVAQDMPRLTRVGAAGSWSVGLTTDGKLIRWNDSTALESIPPGTDLPQPVSAFSASAWPDLAPNTPGPPAVFSLSGITFSGKAIVGSAATLLAEDAVEVSWNPNFILSNPPPWALRSDGSLVTSGNQTLAGAPPIATTSIRSGNGLAVTGDATLPPEFVSADAALAFAAPAEVAATRVWYQCAVVNGAQSYAATGLPPGLALDAASGRVYGQPTASGTRDVNFTATGTAGTGQKTVRFYTDTTVLPVVSSGDRSVPENTPFTHSITPEGAPLAASYTSSNLPSWLTLDPVTGIISGTPPASGVFVIAFKAVNAAGTTSGSVRLTVTAILPVVDGASRTTHEGAWFYHQITATSPPHSAWLAAPLPAGLTQNGSVIFGRLTGPGDSDITLSVTNAAGTATAILQLHVLPRPAAGPPDFIVNTATDELDVPAGPNRSLREALRDAPDGGTIRFLPALTGQTLTLTSGPLSHATPGRELRIRADSPGIVLSGNQASRILETGTYTILHLEGLTFQDGHAPNATAVTGSNTDSISGGAILHRGLLDAADCLFLNNTAGTGFTQTVPAGQFEYGPPGGPGGHGGAIHSTGTLEIVRSRFRQNRAGPGGSGRETGEHPLAPGRGGDGGRGGAVLAVSLTASECDFSANTAGSGGAGALPRIGGTSFSGTGGDGGDGGAVFAASATLRNCFLGTNISGAPGPSGQSNALIPGPDGGPGSGGALAVATLELINCTLHGNSTAAAGSLTPAARYPAGGAVSAPAGRLVHCTISGNAIGGASSASPPPSAARGGGVSGGMGLTIENCIIATNTALFADGHDVFGNLTYAGANLIGVLGTTAGPLNGTAAAPLAPGLLAAAWNGGHTKSSRLAANSPAANAAAVSATTPATDQRGYPRAAGSAPDLGALEMETSPLTGIIFRDLTLTTEGSSYVLRWGLTAGTFQVLQSTTLAADSWTSAPGLVLTVNSDNGTVTAAIPAGPDPHRYFRVIWNP